MICSIAGTLVCQLSYLSLLVHKKCSKPAINKAQNSTIWALITSPATLPFDLCGNAVEIRDLVFEIKDIYKLKPPTSVA